MSEVEGTLSQLLSGADLDAAQLGRAFDEIMDGQTAPEAIAGLLVGLRMKGERVEDIVAVAKALRARAETAIAADPRTVDTCGTGGSGLATFNISTTAAFVVAGAGVSVAKHGNRAATSRSGSFDVLEALGIRIDLPIAVYGKILEQVGIAPFFARTAHPAFRHVAPVRAALGVRTLLNCLGPLLSPVGAKYQVVGVYSEALVEPLAGALAQLGTRRALVVHGSDGMDELTTTGPSQVAWVDEGADPRVRTLTIDPESVGLKRATLSDLIGGDPAENAVITRAILAGEPGPQRDIVALNAGAALWVAEAAESLERGVRLAEQSLDSGAAEKKLAALALATQEAAEEATVA